MASRSLGALTLDLLLKTGGFTKGLEKAAADSKRAANSIQSAFSTIGKVASFAGIGIGITSIVHGLQEAAREAIEFGDEIGKMMAKTGIGAESLQELAFAAEQSEVDLATLSTALRNMQVVVSDSVDANSAAAKTLKELGLSFEDLQNLDADERFSLIAQRISEFKDEADRAALRMDVFKKAGEAIAPVMEGGAAGIREMTDAAHELNAVLSDEQIAALQATDDALDELSASWKGLKRESTAAIAPALTDFFIGLTKVINDDAESLLDWADVATRTGTVMLAFARGPVQGLVEAYKQVRQAGREAREGALEPIKITATRIGTRTRTAPDDGSGKKAANEAEAARKSIQSLITSLQQQAAVTGQTEEATIRYRIAFGDLVDDFKKAGPAFEKRKQDLIDAAAAFDKFKANEELKKANEAIAQQVVDLAAQKIALEQGAAAAYVYQAQHGELAKTLDLATDSQEALNAEVQKGAAGAAALEQQTAINAADELVRSLEAQAAETEALRIEEEQGAVAALNYRIAHGDLKDVFDDLGPAAAEYAARLRDLTAAQEATAHATAAQAAAEQYIPDAAKALKEYRLAHEGLARMLAAGTITQDEFNKAIKQAEKNYKEATKAADEFSAFMDEAQRASQQALAAFFYDPMKEGLEGLVTGFADAIRQIAANIVAAKLAEKLFEGMEDSFDKVGGMFTGPGGGFGGIAEKLGGLLGVGGGGPAATTGGPIDPGLGAAVAPLTAASTTLTAGATTLTSGATVLTTGSTTLTTAATTFLTGTTTLMTASTTLLTAATMLQAAATQMAASGLASSMGSGLEDIVVTAQHVAEGGPIRGPGTGTSDSIPAWLSHGEYVLRAASVQQPGAQAFLNEFNRVGMQALEGLKYQPRLTRVPQRFAAGGIVGGASAKAVAKSPLVIQQSVTINSPNGQVSRQTEMQVTAAAARGVKVADRRNN